MLKFLETEKMKEKNYFFPSLEFNFYKTKKDMGEMDLYHVKVIN